MLTSRENYFHNLGKSEALQRAVKREANPRALRKVDFLAEKIVVAFIQAVKNSYDRYLEDPLNEKKRANYRTWRLRLHVKLGNNIEKIDLLNGHFGLGVYDEGPGPLCFDYDYD